MQKILMAMMAFFLMAVQPAAVSAASVDEAGAAVVKQIVDEAIAFHLDVAKKTGEGFTISGPVSVTPKGSYYEVALPDAKLSSAVMGELKIGTVLVNVSPGKTDTEYLASMALPSPMTFAAKDGSTAEIRIGKQRFAGAWNVPLKTFTRMDADYSDMILTATGEDAFALTVGNVKTLLNLQENADGTWSGPNDFVLANVRLIMPETQKSGETTVTIDSMSAKAAYDGFNLMRAMEMEAAVKKAISGSQDGEAVEMQDLTDSLLKDGDGFFNGLRNELMISNINIDVKPAPNATGDKANPRFFRINTVKSLFDLQGIRTDKGNVAFNIGMAGLTMSNMAPAEIAGYVPSDLNVEFYLDSLPMRDLSKTVSGLLSTLIDTMEQSEAAVAAGGRPVAKSMERSQIMAAAMAVPQMLTAAGSSLSIRNTYLKAPDLDSKLDGNFTANAAAKFMAVGSLTLVLKGLDELVIKTQENKSQLAQKALGGLSMLQMMGKADTEGGKSTRTYKLEVTPEGKVTLNGSDFSSMTGLLR